MSAERPAGGAGGGAAADAVAERRQSVSSTVAASFVIRSWREEAFHEPADGPRLCRARAAKSYEGGIIADSEVEYLMVYRGKESASFVGLERVAGRIGERRGSFVLQHEGSFEQGVARATFSVVPGSATGELAGLRGTGGFASAHADSYPFHFTYDFE